MTQGYDLDEARQALISGLSAEYANSAARLRLVGGYSGSETWLVWSKGGEVHVFKLGPSAQIEEEHRVRQLRTGLGEDADGIYALGPERDVEVLGLDGRPRKQRWRAIAYRYEGAPSFEELRDRGDFGILSTGYVDGRANEDDRINRATVERGLKGVVTKIFAPQPEAGPPDVPWPLADYLPAIPWNHGIRAALAPLDELSPAVNLADIERQWQEAAEKVTVAPLHDHRLLHGDARFANILVDRVSASVALIDYGNGHHGHVFQDLARFEVDLIFRSMPADHPDRQASIRAAIEAVTSNTLAQPESSSNSLARALLIWRHKVSDRLPLYSLPGAHQMYLWFVTAELLKRIRWLRPGDTSGPGASYIELTDAISQVWATVLGEADENRLANSVGRFTKLLDCQAVYIPILDEERVVNEERNGAKAQFLRSLPPRGTAKILAETANSYLHVRGPFYNDLRRLLRSGGSVDVVIADIAGEPGRLLSAAYRKADAELDRATPERNPDLQRKFDESIDGFKALHREYPQSTRLFLCPFAPSQTFLLATHGAFVEPYFLSDRTRRAERLFDTFEMYLGERSHLLQLLAESFSLYVALSGRFNG